MSSTTNCFPEIPARSVTPTFLEPKVESADERDRLAQLARQSKLERVSSMSSNIPIFAALQGERYINPNAVSPPNTVDSQRQPRLMGPVPLVALPENILISEHERILDNLRTLRVADHKQAVYIPPMAKPGLQATDDALFPLMDKVQAFLEGDGQVMLILGDSGAGKSSFNRYLENKLWETYTTGEQIPLFVNLPALDRPDKDLVAEQLKRLDFSEELIMELKRHRQFVVICDGYDESQLTANLHTTNLFNQAGQWNVKLIIACRTQYLGPDYRDRFVPRAAGLYQRAANDLFWEAVIAPFSKDQIEDYVERYVPLEPRTWVKKDYMDKLTRIPNLMDLVRNPFLLTLCLEALPRTVKGTTDLSRLHITRIQLYDNFVDHWLEANKRRLQDQRLSTELMVTCDELMEEGFWHNGIKFQQDLATAIFTHQDGRPIVDYIHRRDKSSWKATFFCPSPEATILRGASLLNRSGSQYRFVHRSILEYFFSCTICPSPTRGPFDFDEALWPIGSHPLSQNNLVVEPSIVRFLAERVKLQPIFTHHLLDIIELSKTDKQASQASTNAMTILILAETPFNGADLQDILIPGADLSGGQFDSAQLQGADLTGANFTKSWIRQANFCGAQMEGVRFGELPYLAEVGCVFSCAFSPRGDIFAVGLTNGDINMYETVRWTRIHALRSHQRRVTSVTFSSAGFQLLSSSWDKIVLWSVESGSAEMVLKGESGEGSAVAFSPCGMWIATAGLDMVVRLLDAHTGRDELVLIGHTSKIICIAYSPDGRSIVSGGEDGSIRIFDVDDELSSLVWESGCAMVNCVAYSPDGKQIVSGHEDGQLRFWEAKTGAGESKRIGHAGDVNSVIFSPSGQWIASCSDDQTVKLWDAQASTLVSVFAGHSDRVARVAFSPEGSRLASTSWDKTVRLWDLTSTGSNINSSGSSDPVLSVSYSPDGRVLLSGSDDGTIRQYNASTGEPGKVFSCGANQANCITYTPCGLRIAAAGNSSDVRVWDAVFGFDYFVLGGHTERVNAVGFSPHNDWIVTASDDMTLRLWVASSGKPGHILSGHTDRVRSVSFSPNGRQIISGSRDGTVRVWDVDSSASIVLTREDDDSWVRAISYSPDGQLIATSHQSMDVRLWDGETFSLVHTLMHDRVVSCIAFSDCSQWITTGCGHAVWLWTRSSHVDMAQVWSRHSVIRAFSGDVVSVAWGHQGFKFATGCKDGSTRVWKVPYESSNRSVQLVWSVGPAVLSSSGAVLVGTKGLSPINRQLLMQRGAIDESSSSPSPSSS